MAKPIITSRDTSDIMGTVIQGYEVCGCRVHCGASGFGIILAKCEDSKYVTWEFYLENDGTVQVYDEHRFEESSHSIDPYAAAMNDFNFRDRDPAPLLSEDYWDCECDNHFIQENRVAVCPLCAARRDEMPDSRQEEVDAGIYFAPKHSS